MYIRSSSRASEKQGKERRAKQHLLASWPPAISKKIPPSVRLPYGLTHSIRHRARDPCDGRRNRRAS